MNHRLIRLFAVPVLLLPCLLVSQAGPAQTASSDKAPIVVFATDPRLEAKVTCRATATPLRLLLKTMSRGCTLTCDRECADQKLQVRVKERSLRSVMQALSDLLPGGWQPLANGSGYSLQMSLKAVRRRNDWWQLVLRERERAKQAQREYVLCAMRSVPSAPKPGVANPEGGDANVESQAAGEQAFFRALPPSLQEQVATGFDDRPYFSRGPLGFGSEQEESSVSVAAADLPPELQAQIAARVQNSPVQDLSRIFVNFTNVGFAVLGSITRPDGSSSGPVFHLSVHTAPDAIPLMMDQQQLVDRVKQLGKEAPLEWKQLAAYQQSRVWPNDISKHRLNGYPPPRRAEALEAVADAAGMEYIADYYSLPARPPEPAKNVVPLRTPVAEELNRLAAEHDLSWKASGDGLYLLRNNRWYRDDACEVTDEMIKHLLDTYPVRLLAKRPKNKPAVRLSERLKLQMDWEAQVTTALTYWQITSGFEYFASIYNPSPAPADIPGQNPAPAAPIVFYPFRSEAQRIMQEANTIQFYASLDEHAQLALTDGNLPFASLTPTQRRQVASLLPALRARLDNQDEPVLLGLRSRTNGPVDARSVQSVDVHLFITQ